MFPVFEYFWDMTYDASDCFQFYMFCSDEMKTRYHLPEKEDVSSLIKGQIRLVKAGSNNYCDY